MRNSIKVCSCLLVFLICVSLFMPTARATANEDPVAILTFTEGGSTYETPIYDLETALDEAREGDTYYLMRSVSLSRSVIVESGVTLVVPTSATLVEVEDLEEGNENVPGAATTGKVFASLGIPTNVTLTVNGTLIVAGNQQSTVPQAGFLTGDYGAIQLEGDLVINGTLYARGEINGGGTLTANKGSTVYQRFEVADWRGGNASLSAYNNRDHSVYPFELYQTGGVNVSAVYMNGSRMMGQSFIYSNQQTVGAISTVNIIGSSNSLLSFDDANDTDASIDFAYNTTTGVFTATINGSVSTGDISVDISIFGIHFPLTATGVGPFGYMLNVVLPEKSTFNVSNELKLLPGCTITVNKDATLNASGRLYAYTSGAYSADYNNAHWTNADNAIIEVLDGGILKGNIGSPDPNFGNIHGVTLTENMTSEKVWEVTQSGTTVTFHDIDFYMSSVA